MRINARNNMFLLGENKPFSSAVCNQSINDFLLNKTFCDVLAVLGAQES